jgi:hypothetical protein
VSRRRADLLARADLDLPRRIDSGLAYLSREQRPNGEFPTFKARDAALARERRLDGTPFATTYVLHALSHLEQRGVAGLVEGALDFLEDAMEPDGVWRYWTETQPKYGFIPPDLDDTCCASAALRRFGRVPPDNEELIIANRNRDGLFYTWFFPRPSGVRSRRHWTLALRNAPVSRRRLNFWRLTEASPWDVDCVVNANVRHYLGDREEARPVVEYLVRALARGRSGSCDKWHRNAFAFHYAVSRAYAAGVTSLAAIREPLAAHLEAALASREDLAAAEIALGVCASLNLSAPSAAVEAGVAHLADAQGSNGAWPAFALYWGGPKRAYGWGSESLTTGLCLEALARFGARSID